MSDHPDFSALPPEQQEIWHAFSKANMSGFMLYGGTALALHYGHRLSIDFDFFSSQPVSSGIVANRIPWLADNIDYVMQDEKDTYTVQVTCPSKGSKNTVKLSFFGTLDFPTLDAPTVAANGIEVASVCDILATKLKACHGRAEAKDYIDIAEILRRSDNPVSQLEAGLTDYMTVFPGANPLMPLKALCWYGDGNLSTVDPSTRTFLEETARAVGDLPSPKLAFRPHIGRDRGKGDINRR